MVKKICPVCDAPLAETNYCKRCRRMVRQPLVWNAEYYLNEMRPAGAGAPRRTEVQEPVIKPIPSFAPGPVIPSATGKTGNNQAYAGVVVVIILALLVFLFSIAFLLSPHMRNLNDDREISFQENFYDDSGYMDFEEEDVKSAGIPCTGFEHFPVSGKEAADSMNRFFVESYFEYQVRREEVYSDNYGSEEDTGVVTYYQTLESFYFEEEFPEKEEAGDGSYMYQYADLDYDTATGELHDYSSFLKSQEASFAFLEEFLRVVESLALIPEEESSVSAIMEKARADFAVNGESYVLEGLFYISIYQEEDGVSIIVQCGAPREIEDREA